MFFVVQTRPSQPQTAPNNIRLNGPFALKFSMQHVTVGAGVALGGVGTLGSPASPYRPCVP